MRSHFVSTLALLFMLLTAPQAFAGSADEVVLVGTLVSTQNQQIQLEMAKNIVSIPAGKVINPKKFSSAGKKVSILIKEKDLSFCRFVRNTK
ncbi:hypothetical protein WDW37_20005 [Bdellovibrionota bacterium FG-1]